MDKLEFQPIRVGESKDLIDAAIEKKAANLLVLTPDVCRKIPFLSAEMILTILAANYGTHNLSNDVSQTARDIASGRMQPFICGNETEGPLSCAALIKQTETDIEIGRGACLPGKNGNGALPLLLAFRAWRENQIFPESEVLRVEIRTAKPTKEVPGGQATQAICLNTLVFPPTAIGPLFHHGSPDRQEMFLLGSKWKKPDITRTFFGKPELPGLIFESSDQRKVFSFFWEKFFGEKPQILIDEEQDPFSMDHFVTFKSTFKSHQQGPILVVEPEETSNISTFLVDNQVLTAFEQGLRFAMARIPLSGNTDLVSHQIFHLRLFGFRTMGFEPVLSQGSIRIDLLLGRLSPEGQNNLVAPCFIEGAFPKKIEDALLADFICWRKANLGEIGGY